MAFQIIHSFEKFINRFNYTGEYEVVLENCLKELQKMKIDGIVININTENGYLESKSNWDKLIAGMRIAGKLGLRMWIYDEKGYPSGGAGGLVLRDNPELEAKGVKYHCGKYYISNIYEGSHAERNFHEKRRYINLLDSNAVRKFAESTYSKYMKKLPPDNFDQAEAFFTDEPSLMTVVTQVLDSSIEGDVPEMLDGLLGKKIPVHDEPDPNVPITPSIPYSEELNRTYIEKYSMDILSVAPGIFAFKEEPSEVKCRFWETVAETYEETYGVILSNICKDLGKKLTGHLLFEETPILNTAFHANPFRVLKHFQLPGIDLLSNIQEKISIFGHKMVFSCAWQKDINGIMTETSDFFEYRMGPKRPTKYRQIIAALYRQFALGVREFSFYYDFNIRKDKYGEIAGTIKNLCDFDKELKFKPDCAIYCSYETVWAGFYPSMAKPFDLYDAQPEFVKRFEDSILEHCDNFYKNNTQFIIMDESSIEELIEKGITQVFLPECMVVNKKLIEYTDSGNIKLFGHTPEYIYSDGNLEEAGSIKIYPNKDIRKTVLPFKYEGDMIYARFEGEIYFCFNPGSAAINIIMTEGGRVFDPVLNKSSNFISGGNYSLDADCAVIIKVNGE